jgi:hypothetical protein
VFNTKSMKRIPRYALATLLLLLAITGYGYFEYSKLISDNSASVLLSYLSVALLFASAFLFLPVTTKPLKECLTKALLITVFIGLSIFGFLKWKSRSELNHVLNAKGHCESVMVELFKHRFQGAWKNAQNICTLRYLKDQIHQEAIAGGQSEIITVGSLLESENRMNETAFVLLLSFYANLESEQNEKTPVNGNLLFKAATAEFNLLEGVLPLFEIYQVRATYEEDGGDSEATRMQKLVELSTLAKTLSVFLAKEKRGDQTVAALERRSQVPNVPALPAGELTLLEVRMQNIHERFAHVRKRWNLTGILESLNVKQNYASEYQRVRAEVVADAPDGAPPEAR